MAVREQIQAPVASESVPARIAEKARAERVLLDLWGGAAASSASREEYQRAYEFLINQALRQSAFPPRAPEMALAQMESLADLFSFKVQVTDGTNSWGGTRNFTLALLRGIKPVHVELLRPQRAFNQQLVARLREAVAHDRAHSPLGDQFGHLRELQDPAAWQIKSHRGPLAAALVEAFKRSCVEAATPLIQPLLERQRRWNAAAVAAVRMLGEWRLDLAPEAHSVLEELERLERLPETDSSRIASRASRPIWVELFRRQEAFNVAFRAAFRSAVAFPYQPNEGRSELYRTWTQLQEPPAIAAARSALPRMVRRPLLSVVVPTYETPEPFLRACVDSVLAQDYERWELCIADDGSKSPHVARILEAYAREDPRIHVQFQAKNGGIARATNAAAAMARGDYVCFLDHDDVIPPHALAEIALRLDTKPDTDVVYTDEDRLDAEGRREVPFFKPDWSPDLLTACNYVCHLLVVRRALFEDVGGIRTGFDGSQDYDLILRLSERTDRIEHIPRVLYHWRQTPQSTAQDPSNKPGASSAGVRALRSHLERKGVDADVVDPVPTSYRACYRVRGKPLVSLLVGATKVERTDALLSSLSKTEYVNREVVLAARPELKLQLPPTARRVVPSSGALYASFNSASREACGDVLVFLHDDVEVVDPLWIEELVSQVQRSEIGVVAPKLCYPDGAIEHAGWAMVQGEVVRPFVHLDDAWVWSAAGSVQWVRNVSVVSSACFAIRREVFESVGPFQECARGHEAVGLCTRVRERGLRIVYTPHVRLLHRGLEPVLSVRAAEQHEPDPYYNPNLPGSPFEPVSG